MPDNEPRDQEFNPYQAPKSLSELPSNQAAPLQADQYQIPAARRTAIAILIALATGLGLVTIFFLLAYPEAISAATTGEEEITDDMALILVIGMLALLQVGAVLAYFIVFLSWLYRCYKNLSHIGGAVPRYTPGWAVGGWFVPIMNLFRPAQVMSDILQYSSPLDRDGLPQVRKGLLTLWWTLFLVSGFVGNVASRSDSVELGLISEMLDMGSRLVTLYLVVTVTRLQADKYAEMTGVGATFSGGLPPPIEPGR